MLLLYTFTFCYYYCTFYTPIPLYDTCQILFPPTPFITLFNILRNRGGPFSLKGLREFLLRPLIKYEKIANCNGNAIEALESAFEVD